MFTVPQCPHVEKDLNVDVIPFCFKFGYLDIHQVCGILGNFILEKVYRTKMSTFRKVLNVDIKNPISSFLKQDYSFNYSNVLLVLVKLQVYMRTPSSAADTF